MTKQVLLYSGGMDSLVLAHMMPDAELLYVDLRTQYSEKEVRSLHDVRGRNGLFRGINVDKRLYLGDREQPNAIIDDRNLFLVLVAAIYGSDIMLGATCGDQSHDKDKHWANSAAYIMNYMRSDAHHKNSDQIRVLLPIKHMSKGQLVAWYLNEGHDADMLVRSVSCYSPEPSQCGTCKSCMRKWLALESNGVNTGGTWEASPLTADWKPVVAALNTGAWRCMDEDLYTQRVLAKHGIIDHNGDLT